ncbi:MAG: phage replication protein, partial [Rhodopirellula bahusiensis]
MITKYPSRQSHHAHKLTRLLFKGCAAQSIGHHAVCLVIHIAHTEDAARYQGPVRFWNSQLMEVLGFKSPKQLNNARDAATKAGWLVYNRANDRSVGHYWTSIPDS